MENPEQVYWVFNPAIMINSSSIKGEKSETTPQSLPENGVRGISTDSTVPLSFG